MERIEDSILANLLVSEKFSRTALPFLKAEYFQDRTQAILLEEISKFFQRHNTLVTPDILSIEVRNRTDLKDAEIKLLDDAISGFSGATESQFDWLVEHTEEFCKKRSIYNAIIDAIGIIEGRGRQSLTEEAIPKLLQDALAVSFDTAVGHSYLTDAEKRFDYYNRKEQKIPFDLKWMNIVTNGGMARKAMYACAAKSGGGKSIFMTHVAANTLRLGKNVLYISLEMSEEEVAKRIDANLLRVTMDSLANLTKDEFLSKVDRIASKTHGKLFIKQYPSGGSAHSGHFRALLEELKTKQNFSPDLIVVDYLGICGSARIRMGGSVNTNSFLKTVAEELRGLAVEYDAVMLTGAQINRGSYDSGDVDMSSTADSIGIVHTLDFYFALIETDDLIEREQMIVKVLKNRYGELNKFTVGVDKPKMLFYDTEDSSQTLDGGVPSGGRKFRESGQNEETTRKLQLATRSGVDVSGFKF